MSVQVSRGIRIVCVLTSVFGLLPAQASAANAVTRWVERALQTVRDQNIGTPNSGRLYAMVSVAIYDAINGIDTADGDTRAHALVPATDAPAGASREAAAIAAAHAVLSSFVPDSYKEAVLDPASVEELEALGANDPSVVAGHDWGVVVGQQVIALRSDDGTQTALIMPAGSGIGEHRAEFDARWANMTPFAIASKDRYRSDPPALTSTMYTAAYYDVKIYGMQYGDPERNEIAQFWTVEANTTREPGVWPQAVLAIVAQYGTVTNLSETARLFALVTMAVADAVSVVWDTKATYFTWRPTPAIQEGDVDGNLLTIGDPAWTSRFGAVGASPEFNSGMASFGAATAEILKLFYCNPYLAFSFATDNAPNGPRFYRSALGVAREAGRSRIYQGIHFQFSNVDGRRVGRSIGREVIRRRLGRAGEVSSCTLR
jgi:hypothetical protein